MSRKPGIVSMGELATAALAPVMGKRGFAAGEIVARWSVVAGADIAEICTPERIVWPRRSSGGEKRPGGEPGVPAPGVLVLRVARAHAIDVQHLSNVIIARVNAYFGYRALGSLRLRPKPLAPPPPERPAESPGLGPEAEAALQEALSPIADDGLRAALHRLGRAALERRGSPVEPDTPA